ncbi:MAG: ABC transporter permease subunit, partial [Chloroflexi bacterium]|nr:ABC transporter permease subunit [Chloroflexota bacterium]
GYTFVVETIFRWPGISRLLIESILQRDYPVALMITLLFTIAVILANFVANIAYSLVDPRIRQETTLRV